MDDVEIFDICAGAYTDDYLWDHLYQGEGDDETYVGIIEVGNFHVVVFRGSTTVLDWVRNFDAGIPIEVEGLGRIAQGFYVGLPRVRKNLRGILTGKRWICTGHSRGAAQATIFAAMMAQIGNPPEVLTVFAPPATCLDNLQDLLGKVKEISAYANFEDHIVPLPTWMDHPYEMIRLNEKPMENDPWGIFAAHHLTLYGEGVRKIIPRKCY